jgi:hypothetical protein
MWIKDQIQTIGHEFAELKMEDLVLLPEMNLEMMVEQITIIWKISKQEVI